MTPEIVVSLLAGQIAIVLGLLYKWRTSLEDWAREMFVHKSEFSTLQEKVRNIESDTRDIKVRTQEIYDHLMRQK